MALPSGRMLWYIVWIFSLLSSPVGQSALKPLKCFNEKLYKTRAAKNILIVKISSRGSENLGHQLQVNCLNVQYDSWFL